MRRRTREANFDLAKFTTADLTVGFERSLRHPRRYRTDENVSFIRASQSDVFRTIIDNLYIVGNYPWSTESQPTVLYSFPEGDTSAANYAAFLLPHGSTYSSLQFHDPGELFQHLYDSTHGGHFYTLYFPENPIAPYIFSYRFRVDPLTFPIIAHSLSLSELLSKMTRTSAPTTEICIAIRTKFPFYELFVGFINWILESDMIARMGVFEQIERFLDRRSVIHDDSNSRLSIHRTHFLNQFTKFAQLPPPNPEEFVVIDCPPCRVFRWKRPSVAKNYYPLASLSLSDVVKHVGLAEFSILFSALLLEKTIIFYHPDEAIVSNVILSLHFILKPLRWVSLSISILPEQLFDMLDCPNPLLVGLSKPLDLRGCDCVYFDLVANNLKVLGSKFPSYPRFDEMQKKLKNVWSFHPKGRDTAVDYTQILSITSEAVGWLITSIEASIVSEVTEADVRSEFFRELFLAMFPQKQRAFAEAFSETQMFQWKVEQACRKRSDERQIEI